MRKILVPTDFSATAKCAFAYARQLADQLGDAEVKVVHMYLPATEAEYPNIVPPIPEFMAAREKMLKDFVEESQAECAPDVQTLVKTESELMIGFPADEITRLSREFDLIVMGTTGETDVLDKLFGSVSSNAARRAHCPVILVPKGVKFGAIDHILYAANYESADDDALEKLVTLNKDINATVHFVHVREKGVSNFDKTKEEIFEELFEDGEPGFAFEIEEVEGESVTEALNKYAEANHIDLVMMASKKRSFWEGFFHRSQTKRMALTTRLPMVVVHLD